MSETYELTMPFVRSPTPPRTILVQETIDKAACKVKVWLETLEPKFTEEDGMEMTKFKMVEEGLELKYEITRNKYKKGE